jgi:hypothetical protein
MQRYPPVSFYICREDEFLDHKGKQHGSGPAAPAAEYLQARQRVAQLMDTTGKPALSIGIQAVTTCIAWSLLLLELKYGRDR